MTYNGGTISMVYYKDLALTAIYRGSVVIWEGIRSCFGGGAWLNAKAWINSDCWKN
jgi:hypothetical protein